MGILRRIKADHPIVEVILFTEHGAVEDAVQGLNRGAFDFLQKPTDREELLAKLAAASRRKADQEERIRSAEARRLVRKTGDI
jgi:DNA-binding response OmpR family regulator